MRAPRQTIRGLSALILVASVLTIGVDAHEEDWRKLADRVPAYRGPGITGQAMSGQVLRGSTSFDADGVELLSWLPLDSFGSPENGADCWGYVSPSGREYAILGTSSGTEFIDVTDPVNPVRVGSIPGAESLWRDVKTCGTYAYAVNETGGGVQVIDLSAIDQGEVTLVRSVTEGGLQTAHNVAVNPGSPYLYLAGSNLGNGSLLVMDLANPADPVIVGRWQQGAARYCHDAQIVTWTDGPLAGREIAFSFDGVSGLHVLDVTDKGAITLIGSDRYNDLRYCHQGWLSPDHTRLYVNDELDELNAPNVEVTTTRVFDVTDPTQPVLLRTFTTGLGTIDHNCYTKDDLVYQANYTSGLRVFRRVGDDYQPVAFHDTHPENDAKTFNGAWSVYPYLPSGTIIVSDIERGLFVARIDNGALPPTMRLIGDPPSVVVPGAERGVRVRVESGGAPLDPQGVALHVKVGDEAYRSYSMVEVEPGTFEADLPVGECAQTLTYLMTAVDTAGRVARLPSAPNELYSGVIARVYEPLVGWGFEGADDAWSDDERDSAVAGRWARATPQPGGIGPDRDVTSGGSACWLTGPIPFNAAFSGDVDGGTTTLLSPPIDLSGFEAGDEGVLIAYHRWYAQAVESRDRADSFRVDVSGDGGRTWASVERLEWDHPDVNTGWVRVEFAPLRLVAPGPGVLLRFVADDVGGDDDIEAGVDEVSVFVRRCDDPAPTACAADWNADGAANAQDFFDFTNDYFQGSGPRGDADINADGFTNAQDFFDYLNAYFAGCP